MPPAHLEFSPYAPAASEPNVVVDGPPTVGTTLTLSHWPGSPEVPADLQADLSAQMAFRYLGRRKPLHGSAKVVSNNHFDQDGLVSVFALTQPEAALGRRALLEDLAAAGDFGTFVHRDAARASMVISAFASGDRSPLGPPPRDDADMVAWLYEEGLGRLVELVDHVERFRDVWAEEDAELTQSEAAIADGSLVIHEHPDVDLAVVSIPEGRRWSGHRFLGRRFRGLHPMALHNNTERTALLVHDGASPRFTYRYEGWVTFRSRAIRPRVDLGPIAEELSAADTTAWSADPVDVLTPEMAPVDDTASSLSPSAVVEIVGRHLAGAPPAFDPFVARRG